MSDLLNNLPFRKREKELEKNIPYLLENKELKIGIGFQHVMIEGDNLHTLAICQALGKQGDFIFADPDNVISKKSRGSIKDNSWDRSIWLLENMPKFKLMKELLPETGVLAVSLNELIMPFALAGYNNISGLLDLFHGNYIGMLVNTSRTGSNISSTNFSRNHEFICLFAKNIKKFKFKGKLKDLSKFKNPDNDPRGPWRVGDLTGKGTSKISFPLINPVNGYKYYPPKGRHWSSGQETMVSLIKENKIIFPKTKKGFPQLKKFANELQSEYQPISSVGYEFFTANGTRDLKKFGKAFFEFPKSVDLVKFLVDQVLWNKKDAVIIDVHGGSGTTAQAVLEYNRDNQKNFSIIIASNRSQEFKGPVYKRVKETIEGNKKVKACGGELAFFKVQLNPKRALLEDSQRSILHLLTGCISWAYNCPEVRFKTSQDYFFDQQGNLKVILNKSMEMVNPEKEIVVEEGLLSAQESTFGQGFSERLIHNTDRLVRLYIINKT